MRVGPGGLAGSPSWSQHSGGWGQPLTLITVLPLVAGRTRPPALPADGVAGHTLRTGTRLEAPRPKEAWHTLCRGRGERGLQGQPARGPPPRTPALTVLTPLAPEASLAGAAAVPAVTGQRVLLRTPALLGAAGPEGPRWTGCTTEPRRGLPTCVREPLPGSWVSTPESHAERHHPPQPLGPPRWFHRRESGSPRSPGPCPGSRHFAAQRLGIPISPTLNDPSTEHHTELPDDVCSSSSTPQPTREG